MTDFNQNAPSVASMNAQSFLPSIEGDSSYQVGAGGEAVASSSNEAEYGDVTRDLRIINSQTKTEMKKILSEIQDGSFAKEFVSNVGSLPVRRKTQRQHQIDKLESLFAR